MTMFTQIDLMARGASIALFVLWSWILMRDHREMLAARIAVAMNVAIMCYILIAANWQWPSELARIPVNMVAGSAPALFWLFTRAWFNDENQLPRWGIPAVVLTALNIMVMQLAFPYKNLIFYTTSVIFRFFMFGFAAAGLWEAWRGRAGDLVEFRRKLRPRIVVAVAIYVMLIAASEIAVYSYDAPDWVVRSVGSSIAVITLLFCGAMFGMRQADLFGPSKKASSANHRPPADEALTKRLLAFMQSEMPHRDEEMTISKLASALGEQEYRLRRHINGAMGHRNFAAFLNGYRLDEVKSALADPSQKDVPIITIALDAGFGSLGPFNRAFREAEGMTPSEYRARATG
ncbi:helix-turn-helix domain-containing protein [Sphingorhabdus sp.]|uniref:AraC family transcriptional regulator n=1 Tax=Sphingorhabdus sp. TaxID=1902408 RepID=UPI0032B7130A